MTNLEDKNFVENVLHKIKEEKIMPKPKWQFLLKNSLLWGLGIIALILGAVSTSLVFYMVTGEDNGLGRNGGSILESLLFIIPFFWIICLTIFALAVFYYIKHTKKGYKYSAKTIIVGIFVISLAFGGALSALGVDQLIDDVLGENAPMYDRVINPRLDYWSNPANGRLTGMVVSEEKPVTYYLVDRNGETWVTQIQNEDDAGKIKVGHPVKLIGEKIGDHSFTIKEVMSIGPGRGFFKRPMSPMTPGGLLPVMCNHNKPCEEKNEKFLEAIKEKRDNFIKDKLKNDSETSTDTEIKSNN
jgi:heme/copper-type cytochrome/quinol oxidase subunit 2